MHEVNQIYLVISPYFPKGTSAYFSFVYDQVMSLKRCSDYRIVVVNPDSDEDYVFDGIDVWGVKVPRFLGGYLPQLVGSLAAWRFLQVLRSHKLDCQRIAVVHGHLASSAKYCNAVKRVNPHVKTLLQFHDCDPFALLRMSPRFDFFGLKTCNMFSYHRAQMEKIDACVAVSRNVGEVAKNFPRQKVHADYEPMMRAMRKCQRCRPARLQHIIVLHTGVDERMFNAEARKAHKQDGVFTVGCVGRFIDLKDQQGLIRALSLIADRLGDWKLILVGGGKMLPKCKELASDLGIASHVEFVKNIEHADTAKVYGMLDLFVLPSYFEAFGCVYVEAAACGVPVMACEGQGIVDILNDHPERWVVRRRDPTDLAAKILGYYQNRYAQKLAEPLSIDYHIKRFLKEIRDF